MNHEASLPENRRSEEERPKYVVRAVEGPLQNYSLSTVCPACNHPTIRHACKVRCERCGFMWDCSEL
jgi:transposase